jgi:small subunit ribosomal protein S5
MGLVTSKKPAKELFKPYTTEEKAALAAKYTPEQIRAIEAGEAAIDIEDLNTRGVIRTDIGALPYLDDLSQTRGVIDKQPKYEGPIDPNARLMTEDEMVDEDWRWEEENRSKAPPLPPTDDPLDPEYIKKKFPTRLDFLKMGAETSMFMGTNGPIPRSQTPSLLAPALPNHFEADEDAVKVKKEGAEEDVDPRDPDGVYNRLMKQTGLTLDEIMDYKVKILVKHRVVNQTRLGKIASLYCLAVAGNGNGRLGIGEAKGQEAEETQVNARIAAIRSMQPIPRYEERTIFGEVEGKVSAVEVKLMSRPPGISVPLSTINLNLTFHRIWSTLSTQHLRNGTSSRSPRSRRTSTTISKQDEHNQSHIPGIDEAKDTRRGCAGERKKARRCAESVLWRSSIIFVHFRRRVCMSMGVA